ncbi:hypothetical protein GLOIN_2v1511099 [Rhizophagus irregularis DAOM 181602=DAOM 197198]|uniref:Uncharacterized protein n=1 Tax=Rhizophagus irregularis (strain DAOM 181602 / DAOM 197198 / MUCL 43194) TaxID=747089 RepID=A0A2P4QU54_RHIID|nr:hypothetical protein GLOIN_2v1511099 [Rhizophagus irregularis DAOM 181602=DAOM 197198]POG81159.1 hypothetical protein GLOIN_2v1511099 [Rhizophagus irregularis DAOM 181602=DAOM 197198]|eukprot:XP_025188025.1 hypothetical protein GLOIN_2v1511099 [Rhizophagus irregularis DAOM 181602=DAOM 197198]
MPPQVFQRLPTQQLPQQQQQLLQQSQQQLNFNPTSRLVVMTRCSVCTLICYSSSGICELCQAQLSSQGFTPYTNDNNNNYYDYNVQASRIQAQAVKAVQAAKATQLHAAQIQAARAAQSRAVQIRALQMLRSQQIQRARAQQFPSQFQAQIQAQIQAAKMAQAQVTQTQLNQSQPIYNNNYGMPPTSSSDTSSSDTSANAIISTNKSKLAKTQLKVLPLHDNEFIQIQRYFLKGLPHARIHTIIKLQMPTKLVEAHEQYKKTLLNNPSYGSNMTTNNLISSMKSNNNLDKHTNTMFHGTKISCNPQRFINGNSNFCLFSCGMCGIIQNGNQGKYSRFNGSKY